MNDSDRKFYQFALGKIESLPQKRLIATRLYSDNFRDVCAVGSFGWSGGVFNASLYNKIITDLELGNWLCTGLNGARPGGKTSARWVELVRINNNFEDERNDTATCEARWQHVVRWLKEQLATPLDPIPAPEPEKEAVTA